MVALSDAVPYYVLAVGAVGARVGLVTARPCPYFGMSSVTVAELGTVPVDVYQTTVAVFVELNVYGQNVTPVSLDIQDTITICRLGQLLYPLGLRER